MMAQDCAQIFMEFNLTGKPWHRSRLFKHLLRALGHRSPDTRIKLVIDLQEHEVDLLWPSKDGKGSWKVLSGKRRANLESFCHQQLNAPVGFASEDLHIFSKEEFERGMLTIGTDSYAGSLDAILGSKLRRQRQ